MSVTVRLVLDLAFAAFAICASIAIFLLYRKIGSMQGPVPGSGETDPSRPRRRLVPSEAASRAETKPPVKEWWKEPYDGPVGWTDSQEPVEESSSGADRSEPGTGGPPTPGVPDLEVPSFDGAVADYNGLVANFSRADLRRFEERWHPEAVSRAPGNGLDEDATGELWLIQSDVDRRFAIVVPGPEPIREWELYYRSMGSSVAKDLLSALYDVRDNAPLRVERPAIATRTDGRWKVEIPGRFAEG